MGSARFHRTLLEEFDQIRWRVYYNGEPPPRGRYCYGQAPLLTFQDW